MHPFRRRILSDPTLSGLALISLSLTGCATVPDAPPALASGIFRDGAGVEHGAVSVTQAAPGQLRMAMQAGALSPGLHGVHIHAKGLCEGPAFASANAHWNPDHRMHGLDNPMGAHRGDLPQMTVAADGNGQLEFTISSTIDDLLDADGASVIIHAAADDNRTDPSGNSGARLYCAVLSRGG